MGKNTLYQTLPPALPVPDDNERRSSASSATLAFFLGGMGGKPDRAGDDPLLARSDPPFAVRLNAEALLSDRIPPSCLISGIFPVSGTAVGFTGTDAGVDGDENISPLLPNTPVAVDASEDKDPFVCLKALVILAMPRLSMDDGAFLVEAGVAVRGEAFTDAEDEVFARLPLPPLLTATAGDAGEAAPGALPSLAFQRFLTAFSVRPGKCLAISAHLGPSSS